MTLGFRWCARWFGFALLRANALNQPPPREGLRGCGVIWIRWWLSALGRSCSLAAAVLSLLAGPLAAQDSLRVTLQWRPPAVDTTNPDPALRRWPAQFYHLQIVLGDTTPKTVLYPKALGANYGHTNCVTSFRCWRNVADTIVTFPIPRPVSDSAGPYTLAIHAYRAPALTPVDSSAWIYGPWTYPVSNLWVKPPPPLIRFPGPVISFAVTYR